MTTPVQPDQLRISIEMGDQYQTSPQLRAALEDLAAALGEDSSEVEGFLLKFEIQFKSFSYDSALATGGRPFQGPSGTIGSTTERISLKDL